MAEEHAGTAAAQALDEFLGTDDELTDTTEDAGEAGATAGQEPGQHDGRLLDPATLPEELKPHWSRMTKAYNQRLGAIKEREAGLRDLETKAELVDRFYNDKAYAQQVITQMAQQLGYQLTPTGQAGGQSGHAGTTAVPEAMLNAARDALADTPDLAFLAPYLAKFGQQLLAPLQQERQQQHTQQQAAQQEQQAAELQQAMDALEQVAPDWSEHEDDMADRATWLRKALTRTGPLVHPRYGNAMELLYQLVTGQGRATAEAGRRMSRVLTNRTTTGQSARNQGPTVQEQIRGAKTHQDRIAIAFEDALNQMRGG